jgi:hypothetical protein
MEETAEQIESAIAALEAQRALLGDAVVADGGRAASGEAGGAAPPRGRNAAAEDRYCAFHGRRRLNAAKRAARP